MDEDTIYKIIPRHDISTNWILNNPVLSYGEYGIEDDTHKIKRGDGKTDWVTLQYDTLGIDLTVEDELAEQFVKKEEGKGLSTNDFTNTLKDKLDNLHNYNDTEVRELIQSNTQDIEANTLNIEQNSDDISNLNVRIDDLNIPYNTSDLNNDGDGTSSFATQEYVGVEVGNLQNDLNTVTEDVTTINEQVQNLQQRLDELVDGEEVQY